MEIAEYENGSLARRYIPGHSVDQRVAKIENDGSDTTHFYHANRLGSVQAVVNASGVVTDKYIYTPFGVQEIFAADSDINRPSGNPFRYTGRRYDVESGLYYYRARYYDSELGRFLETDPVGYADQMNMYAYTHNDPLNFTDPSGEVSYLIARPLKGKSYLKHMFVLVVDDKTGKITRFSYGPSHRRIASPGNKLVSVVDPTGKQNPTGATDIGDQAAATAFLNDAAAAAEMGIVAEVIDATDAAVIASGKAVNLALGTKENPGNVSYAPVVNEASSSYYANSNSAAHAVADRANPNVEQKVPEDGLSPGWGQSDHIPNRGRPVLPGKENPFYMDAGRIIGSRGSGSRIDKDRLKKDD